jgi:hypothetical protein
MFYARSPGQGPRGGLARPPGPSTKGLDFYLRK